MTEPFDSVKVVNSCSMMCSTENARQILALHKLLLLLFLYSFSEVANIIAFHRILRDTLVQVMWVIKGTSFDIKRTAGARVAATQDM